MTTYSNALSRPILQAIFVRLTGVTLFFSAASAVLLAG
jgi:hypothetical protein